MFKQSILFVVMLAGLSLVSCSSDKAAVEGEEYGQGVTLAEAMPLNKVFSQVDQLNGKVIRVSGTVSDICKHKGCWIQVSDGSQVMTVRFKDEAFTLPADAAGRNVDFEGLLIAEAISNPLGEHSGCAEDGDHSGDAACESDRAAQKAVQNNLKMRYTMVSTGLVLL